MRGGEQMKRPNPNEYPITDERTFLEYKKNVVVINHEKYVQALEDYIDELEHKPDTNTPFFGNSGVKIPLVEQKPLVFPSEEEIDKVTTEYATVEIENDEGHIDTIIAPTAEMFEDGVTWAINWIKENNK
jgi:hypothetical protein